MILCVLVTRHKLQVARHASLMSPQCTCVCTTSITCRGKQLPVRCMWATATLAFCMPWEGLIRSEVFVRLAVIVAITIAITITITITIIPGVVCGGSATLSSTGGYPNGFPPPLVPPSKMFFFFRILEFFPHPPTHTNPSHSSFVSAQLGAGFFGWGYEDHELLWRTEMGGGGGGWEPNRQHWAEDR